MDREKNSEVEKPKEDPTPAEIVERKRLDDFSSQLHLIIGVGSEKINAKNIKFEGNLKLINRIYQEQLNDENYSVLTKKRFWDDVGMILRWLWDHFAKVWDHFMIILGSFWDDFVMIL